MVRRNVSNVEQIKHAIEGLTEEEFAQTGKWLPEKNRERWDRQLQEDAEKGEIDFLVQQAQLAEEQNTLDTL